MHQRGQGRDQADAAVMPDYSASTAILVAFSSSQQPLTHGVLTWRTRPPRFVVRCRDQLSDQDNIYRRIGLVTLSMHPILD